MERAGVIWERVLGSTWEAVWCFIGEVTAFLRAGPVCACSPRMMSVFGVPERLNVDMWVLIF